MDSDGRRYHGALSDSPEMSKRMEKGYDTRRFRDRAGDKPFPVRR